MLKKINDDDIEKIKLQDVFDMKFLQAFQDSFAKVAGVAAITVDLDGNAVTKPTNFTDFCMRYNRGNAIGNKRCMECDKNGGAKAAHTGKPAVYKCHAGLMDFGAPIMLKGKQIGSIIGGQVLTEKMYEDKFKSYAAEIGASPAEYVEAARKVTCISREKLEEAANVFYIVAKNVSNMGYNQYRLHKLKEMSEQMNDGIKQVASAMDELSNLAKDVASNQQELSAEISKVEKNAGKINEFTELIKKIAQQTRLLGLNASIEAARAGVAGAGFGVVAEEIGKLADSSNSTVENIQQFMDAIKESVNGTVDKSKLTSDIVAGQNEAIKKTAADLTDVAAVGDYLYGFTHQADDK